MTNGMKMENLSKHKPRTKSELFSISPWWRWCGRVELLRAEIWNFWEKRAVCCFCCHSVGIDMMKYERERAKNCFSSSSPTQSKWAPDKASNWKVFHVQKFKKKTAPDYPPRKRSSESIRDQQRTNDEEEIDSFYFFFLLKFLKKLFLAKSLERLTFNELNGFVFEPRRMTEQEKLIKFCFHFHLVDSFSFLLSAHVVAWREREEDEERNIFPKRFDCFCRWWGVEMAMKASCCVCGGEERKFFIDN